MSDKRVMPIGKVVTAIYLAADGGAIRFDIRRG